MPIPDANEIRLPLLEAFKDETPHSFSINEILEIVAENLGVSLDEMSSVEKTAFKNNISEAQKYLRKNKFLSHPSKNIYMITRAGLEHLESELKVNDEPEQEQEIPVDFSEQEFLDAPEEEVVNDNEPEPEEFLDQDDPIDTDAEPEEANEAEEPEQNFESQEEITAENENYEEREDNLSETHDIENVLKKYNEKLAETVLEKTAALHQDTFRALVMDLLSKMGYRVFQNARYTNEAAGSDLIHGVILEDKAEMTPIYIQARKLSPEKSVGKADMQDFIDALADKGGKGLFATLGTFSEQAEICANDERIMLIDGKKLAGLMISHNFCVNTERIFELKSIDEESFSEYKNS
ncbi:MAG: restriction endonuclease [Synergistales bacterium]|nr:restriction endonuclease [Synergistales bacterium]MDY6401783.1 restriction endonuclease [Synergistales bacterium]MDY6404456.1 restriction endonuclease [Synergistales bacterium]MDY6410185.1 restriction endonuclease [Synergistales bacterium]MDY6414243.1 restriction endonuclease [Synergistales bacterium]